MIDNKRKRILLVGYLAPPKEGTASITELILSSEHIKEEFNVKLFEILKVRNAQNRGRLATKNIFLSVVNIIRLLFYLIGFRPEAAHIPISQNKYGFIRDSFFILVSKLFRVKTCVHFHGGNFDLFYKAQSNLVRKHVEFVLKFADKLVLLGEKFKKQFANLVDDAKLDVLYNCIKADNFTFKQLEERRMAFKTRKNIRVLFVGYVSKAKGALDLVYSVPYVLKKSKLDFEFVLCGQGIDYEPNINFINDPHNGFSKIKAFIKDNKLENRVLLRGPVDDSEKENLFLSSDIFVFPTYSEGCGLIAMEALSYGLPLIVSRVGALEEMLVENENCLYLKLGDYENIAELICALADDESRRKKMSENSYNVVRDKFNPQLYSTKLVKIWADLFN